MFVSIDIDIAVNVCFFLTLVINLARIILRKVRREAFVVSDYLTFAGLVCVAVSVACENYIMIYGDNSKYSCSECSMCSITNRAS